MVQTPQDDFWKVTSALDPPSPVRLVSAAGGLVVAAGASLHMLRPGSRRLRSRALPPEHEVVAIAAEPWSPYRVAIATTASVGVYTGHRPYEPMLDITIARPDLGATHVAWSRRDDKTLLYVRQGHGEVLMVDLDAQSIGTLTTPRVAAIAGDANGAFAMIDLNPEPPANVGDAWILPAGAKEWTTRWVDCGSHDETKQKAFLAVHGAAVAYSTEPLHVDYSGNVEVSWEEEGEEGDLSFEGAPGVFMGPIAFQSDRVIFAAYNVEGQVNVLRWERNPRRPVGREAYLRKHEGDTFKRIARFGLDDAWKGTEATVTGIAWDDERRTLWAASPELGLLALEEPGPGRGNVALN